ncbi:hypothetical protein EV356DRAFT_137274 [Viridothelium virens]|uniref:Uncharacterized protein n=1 Tax=Viridothelium virens TaxID=1048519 RepID=A0A6A6H9P6_VIRVR|nr:hypothetical protein EV356DRAFT_137274 [Viridothelium virens]
MASLLIRDSTTELTSFPCLKLRDDLEDLSVPNDNSVPQNRRFFPRSSVKRLCTEGWISSALHCCCLKCREHRQTAQRPPNSPYYYAAIIGENKSSRCDSGRVGILFALCVCSECPSLIYSFIDKGITDDYFENHMSQFTASNIRQKYWSSIHPRYSERFHWNKYRFATPFLKKILFDEYPSEIILPFLKESRLGKQNKHGEIEDEGSYGKVFAFEILDEYFAIPVGHEFCALHQVQLMTIS